MEIFISDKLCKASLCSDDEIFDVNFSSWKLSSTQKTNKKSEKKKVASKTSERKV